MATPQASAAEDRVRTRYLEQHLRIRLSDSPRAICGMLVCIDSQGNAILNEAVEQTLDPQTDEVCSERHVPMVMIPGKWISTVAVLPAPPVDPLQRQAHAQAYLGSSMYL
ncbi:uncharacterized protein MJAP1_003811 [Malassezia japonica]|uniref:Sm domain-containing protein n=1 Tax=Malassezia japonica TaxID=223818 RepID=A0AAF0F9K1_9BASI|nr:uncharacterized protein MJAP1_003811 [Malassezia japonica]WFD40822.1 hypothetical protein MJAP1_003811 [Malassezia japonica]